MKILSLAINCPGDTNTQNITCWMNLNILWKLQYSISISILAYAQLCISWYWCYIYDIQYCTNQSTSRDQTSWNERHHILPQDTCQFLLMTFVVNSRQKASSLSTSTSSKQCYTAQLKCRSHQTACSILCAHFHYLLINSKLMGSPYCL